MYIVLRVVINSSIGIMLTISCIDTPWYVLEDRSPVAIASDIRFFIEDVLQGQLA